MSSHALLNSLTESGKKIRCVALPTMVFPNEFNKFNDTKHEKRFCLSDDTKITFHSRFVHQISRNRH